MIIIVVMKFNKISPRKLYELVHQRYLEFSPVANKWNVSIQRKWPGHLHFKINGVDLIPETQYSYILVLVIKRYDMRIVQHRTKDLTYKTRNRVVSSQWVEEFFNKNHRWVYKIFEKHSRLSSSKKFKTTTYPHTSHKRSSTKYESNIDDGQPMQFNESLKHEKLIEEKLNYDADILMKDPRWKLIKDPTDIDKIFPTIDSSLSDLLKAYFNLYFEEIEEQKKKEQINSIDAYERAEKLRKEQSDAHADFLKKDMSGLKICNHCGGDGGVNSGCKKCGGTGWMK